MLDAGTQLSPLDALISQQLPGMGEHALPVPCEDEELERLPIHTATRVRNAEPARYALAVGLFFGERMSTRQVCRYCRMSPHTLAQIIESEIGGRTAEEWRGDLLSRLRTGGTLAASAMVRLLMDDDAVDMAGIKGVASANREITHAHELLSGKLAPQGNQIKQLSDEEAALAYVRAQRSAQATSITPAPMDCAGGKEEGSREGERVAEDGDSEVSHD